MNRRSFLLALPVAAAAAKLLPADEKPLGAWREQVVGPLDVADYDFLQDQVDEAADTLSLRGEMLCTTYDQGTWFGSIYGSGR